MKKLHWWQKFRLMITGDCYITPHFKYSEFACKDGTPYPPLLVDLYLLPLCLELEIIRKYYGGAVITIVSGYRTPQHNRAVGGAKLSRHVVADACDFTVQDTLPRRVAIDVKKLIDKGELAQGGVGSYTGWTHYDIRGKLARWRK